MRDRRPGGLLLSFRCAHYAVLAMERRPRTVSFSQRKKQKNFVFLLSVLVLRELICSSVGSLQMLLGIRRVRNYSPMRNFAPQFVCGPLPLRCLCLKPSVALRTDLFSGRPSGPEACTMSLSLFQICVTSTSPSSKLIFGLAFFRLAPFLLPPGLPFSLAVK